MGAGGNQGAVQLRRQDTMEGVVDQRRFATSGDTADDGQTAERNF